MTTSTQQAATAYGGGAGRLPFDLPDRVWIREVGPRDGFQLETALIPTADKVAVVDALSASGLPAVQLTSLVHPKAVPQLADAEDVLAAYAAAPGVDYHVLVPNLRGAERALPFGVAAWELMLSVTDSHSLANSRRPTREAFEQLRPVIDLGHEHGVELVGALGTALGCPFEGRTPYARVSEVVELWLDAGVRLLTLADTAGLADPAHVFDVCDRLRRDHPDARLILHLHDTRGLGMANAMAGMAAGVTRFDASVGGLGGCPYAPGATGNIATEELVHLLALLGVETGVELDPLLALVRGPVAAAVDHPLESSLVAADPSWVLSGRDAVPTQDHSPPDRTTPPGTQ